MATMRQKKLARAVVESLTVKPTPTKQELVENAGYSHLTADRASKNILESKGVKESLVAFGFNEDRAKAVVGEILEAGENDTVKLKAADMIFKVHGTYAPEKAITLNINEERSSKLDAIVAQIEYELDAKDTTGH